MTKLLTPKLALELYGNPDANRDNVADPRWEADHIVYCGGVKNGRQRAELPAMPGVPDHFWFAVHERAEPKLRAAFAAAQKACPSYKVKRAGCYVFRHQRHDPTRPLSNHASGAATDVDPATNAAKYVDVTPWTPEWYALYPDGLPREWVEGFLSVGGIGWGGNWTGGFVDPQHFEVYDPEA